MSYKNATAFKPWSFKGLTLRNRIAMAPMTRRKAPEDGIATDEIAAYYARRAREEVGLVISEGTSIDGTHAYDTLTVPRFQTPEQIAAWKKVVDAVHEAGGAFAPQLWHTGRLAANPIGPCDDEMPARGERPARPIRAMAAADFEQVLGAYRHSARQAKAIGCDALEIHGAHGYLLDSFVSPSDNKRTDQYGGSFEARMSFPLEVVRAIREEVGPEYPVIYRFSQWKMDAYKEVKFNNPDELGVWVNALKEAGVDILHVSTRSCLDVPFESADKEKTLAGWTRELSGLPTIAVGKVSTTLAMNEAYGETKDVVTDPGPCLDLIDKGEADLIAVGRALIANPDWVKVVRDGDWKGLKTFEKSLLEALV